MLRSPSLQNEYTLVFSGDPALDLPADEAERALKLRVARDTGRWSEIVKPGEAPTVFRFRQIPGAVLTWMHGETERRGLTQVEGFELFFRLALVGVDGFGDYKPEYEHVNGRRMLAEKSLEPIYAVGQDIGQPMLGRRVIAELGAFVMKRAFEGVPPL